MSNYLIEEYPLLVLPSLATAIGLNEAIFVQQLHFFTSDGRGHERDGRHWVYNTLEGWGEVFPFWSRNTLRRTIDSAVKRGVVLKSNAYNKIKMDKTMWYAVDREALSKLVETADLWKSTHHMPKMGTSSAQNGHMSSAQNGQTNNHNKHIKLHIEKESSILCPLCGKTEIVDEAQGQCEKCLDKQAKEDFATEVLTAWNLSIQEIPSVTLNDNTTTRIVGAVELRDRPTAREKDLRKTLSKLYDDEGFRALWREALDAAMKEKGMLAQKWFNMEFWLSKKRGMQPNWVRIMNGEFSFLTEKLVAPDQPAFRQHIDHVPGNVNF